MIALRNGGENEAGSYGFRILIRGFSLVSIFIFLLLEFSRHSSFLFLEDRVLYTPDYLRSIRLSDTWIPISDLDPEGLQYLVEVEDKRFYVHNGFSPSDIQSAFLSSFLWGDRIRGASTITQQLARTLFLKRHQSVERKWREIYLASRIEEDFTKRDILEFYVNEVYWGHNLRGIESAARYYFSTKATELDPRQWQILVQILKRPDYFSKRKIQEIYDSVDEPI